MTCLAFSTLLPPLQPDMIAEAMVCLMDAHLKYVPLDDGESVNTIKLIGPAGLKLYVVGSTAIVWGEQGATFDTDKIRAMIRKPCSRARPLVVDWHRDGWRLDSHCAVNYTVPPANDEAEYFPWDALGEGSAQSIISLVDDLTPAERQGCSQMAGRPEC